MKIMSRLMFDNMTEPVEVCDEKPKEGSINRGNLSNIIFSLKSFWFKLMIN